MDSGLASTGRRVLGSPGLALLLAVASVLLLIGSSTPFGQATPSSPAPGARLNTAGHVHPLCNPSIVKNVTITLTNSASSATGVFEENIFVNSFSYRAYINSTWSNVKFIFVNGTAIQAWVESAPSNLSGNTSVWLHIFNIAGSSSLTVYMDVLSGCNSTVMGLTGPTGEAPQLSASYGANDNGWKVFLNLYDNFSGMALKTAIWTNASSSTAGTVNIHNGLQIVQGSAAAAVPALYSNTNFTRPQDVEWYGNVPGACSNHDILGMGWPAISLGRNSLGAFCDAGTDQFEQHVAGGTVTAGAAITSALSVYRMTSNATTGETCFYTNYVAKGCATNKPTWNLRIAAGLQHGAINTAINATWVRDRANITTVSSSGLPTPVYTVTGTVHGIPSASGAQVLVAGANITIIPTVTANRGSTKVYQGQTNAQGVFLITVPTSDAYTVYSNRSVRFGGDYNPVQTATGLTTTNLLEYPYVGYSNTSYRLPAWNRTSGFTSNCNQVVPCKSGSPAPAWGYQQPVIGWASDAVYYVNNSTRLIAYSMINGTARNVAPWLTLYENIMSYNGIENLFWMTEDDEYAYEFGCLGAPCITGSTITAYAVNITTGRHWEWNYTSVTDANFQSNAEVWMLGENGNYSLLTVSSSTGTMISYNIWTGVQSTMTNQITPFEANNAYWIPQINSMIDVVANGGTSDYIIQYRLTGAAPGTTWTNVSSLQWSTAKFSIGGAFVSDVNVTAHTFVVTEAVSAYNYAEQIVQLSAGTGGTMTGFNLNLPVANRGATYPNDSVTAPLTTASEHRPGWDANTPGWSFLSNDMFYNFSEIVDPATSMWYDTNLSLTHNQSTAGCSGVCYQNRQGQIFPSADEGLYYNDSYILQSGAYDCRTNASSCVTSNLGTSGTVWWAWRSGAPKFPYPASAAPAQPCVPSAINSITETAVSYTVEKIAWAKPTSCANPITNYTLFWGTTSGALNHKADLYPTNKSFNIGGLTPGTTYYFQVEAWNLHWYNQMGSLSFVAGLPPSAPTGLTVTGSTTSTVSLSWTNPGGGGLLNNTVYYGTTCGSWTTALSTSGAVISYTVTGLSAATKYCFTVTAWNATGQSLQAANTNGTTTPGQVTGVGANTITAFSLVLTWSNPSGTLVNDSIYYGTSCGSLSTHVSVGSATTSRMVSGLSGATTYCFEVAAWSGGGSGVPSATFNATTLPNGVTALAVSAVTKTSVSVSWTNPSGTLVNDTVYYGATCAGATGHSAGVVTTFTANGLAWATKYCFKISAWSSQGQGNLTWINGTTLPGSATGLTLTSITFGVTVHLSWSNPNGTIANDTILAGTTCGAWTIRQSTGGAATTGTVNGLTNLTTYCFAIQTWSAGGNGTLSSTITDQPAAPTALTNNGTTSATISVKWTPPASVVFKSTIAYGVACGSFTGNVTVNGPYKNGTVGGLVSGTTYCMAVADWGYGGESVNSATANFTTTGGVPLVPPFSLHAIGETSGSVTLAWTNPAGRVDNITIWFGITCSPTNQKSGGLLTTGSVTGLLASTTYCFEVQAWRSGQASNLSSPAIATTLATPGGGPPGCPQACPFVNNTTLGLGGPHSAVLVYVVIFGAVAAMLLGTALVVSYTASDAPGRRLG